MPPKTYINQSGIPYANLGAKVVARSAERQLEDAINREMTALVAGRTGTAETMQIFSAHNHVAGTYTRNAALWCKDLISQLTGCAVVAKWGAAGNWIEQRLGTMITDVHYAQCRHSPIEYKYDVTPTMFRFIDANGNVVDRTALSQSEVKKIGRNDIVITLLNEAVPVGIHKMPVLVLDRDLWRETLGGYYAQEPDDSGIFVGMGYGPYAGPCAFGISQGTNGSNGQKAMAYTCQTIPVYEVEYHDPSDTILSHVYYAFNGDSGTPRMYLIDGTLALCKLTGAGTIYDHADFIDSRIAMADANAIALGTLAEPTGLTVTRITNPFS